MAYTVVLLCFAGKCDMLMMMDDWLIKIDWLVVAGHLWQSYHTISHSPHADY